MRNRYWELHATPNGDIERRVVIARDNGVALQTEALNVMYSRSTMNTCHFIIRNSCNER